MAEKSPPTRIVLDARGDLDGHGEWTIASHGPLARATYDWHVLADKPLLRHLSFLFKPVFTANHRWAMARGEEGLRIELARRRAESGTVLGLQWPGSNRDPGGRITRDGHLGFEDRPRRNGR